jgi:hypothetical protein
MRLILILVAALVLIVFYRLALKGKIGHFSCGVGNALFRVHTLLRPSAQNIVEAKKQRREDTGQGDDKPPELPPWAQSDG